ncbi:MAG: glycogen synthase [bacterium]|nr:glycogen synthase [bacterium]
MNVLLVASECTPFAKVGGMGDVIGALPQAIVSEGVNASVILPLYAPLLASMTEHIQVNGSDTFTIHFEGEDHQCELYITTFLTSAVTLYLIKNVKYLSNGGIYLSPDAMAVGNDEPRRFMFFCKAVYALLELGVISADVIHCHDWHTSFLLKLIHDNSKLKQHTRTVLSLHNFANFGKVTDDALNREIDGTTDSHLLIITGVDHADAVVPVSKNYAKELLRGEFCFGFEDAILRNKDKIRGITNGIDTDYFNPQKDPFIGRTYTPSDWIEGKMHSKMELFKQEHWDDANPDETFVFGFVGRIVEQKNIQLLIDTIMGIHNTNIRFVFLGVGESGLTNSLHNLALKHNNRVKFVNRFDEALARTIYAGTDAFLVPSLYEPCGLTQMIAMRYGSLPIGRTVGGLVDTIDDSDGSQNGFLFEKSTVEELEDVLLYVYDEWLNSRDVWKQMVQNALTADFSWKNAAREYIQVYYSID